MRRAPGEQVDVWVLRSAEAARLHFWGISQMAAPAAREALAAARSLWFLGTPPDGDHQWCASSPPHPRCTPLPLHAPRAMQPSVLSP